MQVSDELYVRLVQLGIIPEEGDNTRNHNVGASDYALHIIQPWSVWMDWHLDPWDADIVKRICRCKQGENEETKYKKIIHICEEKLRQIKCVSKLRNESIDLGE